MAINLAEKYREKANALRNVLEAQGYNLTVDEFPPIEFDNIKPYNITPDMFGEVSGDEIN